MKKTAVLIAAAVVVLAGPGFAQTVAGESWQRWKQTDDFDDTTTSGFGSEWKDSNNLMANSLMVGGTCRQGDLLMVFKAEGLSLITMGTPSIMLRVDRGEVLSPAYVGKAFLVGGGAARRFLAEIRAGELLKVKVTAGDNSAMWRIPLSGVTRVSNPEARGCSGRSPANAAD